VIHYTVNTGHSRISPRDEVSREVIKKCIPWTQAGTHTIPVPGWTIRTDRDSHGLICTLYRGPVPVVTFAVAASKDASDAVWSNLESFYYDLTDLPGHRSVDWKTAKQPESAPWIAAVIVSPLTAAEA